MEFNLFTINTKGLLFKSYEIIGETQPDYTVKSQGLLFKTMTFYDHNQNVVLKVNRAKAILKKKYEILREGSVIAKISQISQLPKPRLEIKSDMGDFEIVGNFLRNNFTIIKDNNEIAKISRKQLKSTGRYGVAINDSEDPEFILALVMIIEMNIQEQNASSG